MNFDTLSVLDSRYAQEAQDLLPYFTENAFVEYLKKVECAILDEHCKRHDLALVPNSKFDSIDAQAVYEEEKKTHHQLRALVNLMQAKLDFKQGAFVHLGVTSSDVQDTANILRIRDAFTQILYPELKKLKFLLIEKMTQYRRVNQIGRTHGQWAIPMTFGWWWAEYVSRVGQSLNAMIKTCPNYGKISGAVGTYDAMSYLYLDPIEFEVNVLDRLDLKKAEYASQIIPADGLVRFLSEVNICFGVLANLADDLRNLQRSEIGEVREEFTDTQVGSSTMPHKRNPWNSEHVKSLWKEFAPRYLTFTMDLISEHQRDLTNSASSRFITEYLTGFHLAVSRTIQTLEGLQVDTQKMQSRCEFHSAEKAYILLAEQGYPNAHETIRRITTIAQADGVDFEDALKASDWWDKIKDRYYVVHADVSQEVMSRIADKYLTE